MPPRLLLIAGGSCSGKTTVAEAVAAKLGSARLISMDWYYRDLAGLSMSEREAHNFDHPSAIDREMLRRHIENLLNGERVQTPGYDFATHTRLPETVSTAPEAHLIVEGLHALQWSEIRRLAHTKVFVALGHEARLARRIVRDMKLRGRHEDGVRNRYAQSVRPMHDRFVEPTRGFADLVVQGDGDVGQLAEVVTKFHRSRG